MDFKVGLSAKPKKDAAIAKVASEGEKHLKEALKEVLDEIGMCMENARLIDQRVKEMSGQAAFEIEKKLAEAGNARITHLARSLGFDVEIDEDEPSDEDAMASLGEVEAADDDGGDDDGGEFNLDDDDDDGDDEEFNLDDDGDDDDDGEFNLDDDGDDGDDEEFNFDDDGDDDDDEEFKFD